MKILLLGEYSNLHNSLKKGLCELGHDVTLISTGDGFKSYSSDILYGKKPVSSKYKLLKKIFKIIFKYPFSFYYRSFQFEKIIGELEGYDMIQLINEHAIEGVPYLERKQLSRLKKQNKKMVLLCCGDDFNTIQFQLNSTELKYYILTPYLTNDKVKSEYEYSLKYLTKSFKKLSKHIENITIGVIASDIDYHLSLQNNTKYLGLIPNPVVLNKLKPTEKQDKKIRILLGINSYSYIKKGIGYFEKALTEIEIKYPGVIINKTKNLPFSEYLKELNRTDILLDQVFGYDQGYNALEAMALGKVVFTGAEGEFLQHYKLKEDEVAINALPDVEYLVGKLSELIEEPKRIQEIGKNAKAFITKHHDATKVAKTYLETWKKAIEQQP
jgi:glycosyltransferase involved in cell wall biosynthesis